MASINYDKENLCIDCNIKFPKTIIKCSECGNKLRTSARTSWKNKTRMRFKVLVVVICMGIVLVFAVLQMKLMSNFVV